MDMLNILKNFDAADKGEKTTASTENKNDMKAILESIQSVEECGEMGPTSMPEPDKVTMNVNLNARGADAIEELIGLIGGKREEKNLPVPTDGHDDMMRLMALASEPDGEEEMEEEWDNAPEEEYSDTKTMTKDFAGGLNREKKQYAKAQDGDNAMAVETDDLEESIKAQLMAALQEKFAK